MKAHLILLMLVAVAGCNNSSTRIRNNPAAFKALDPLSQERVRRGEVDVGFTTSMVELSLGRPTQIVPSGTGNADATTWIYRSFHRDENDYVRAGYRRRVVFDPVRRSNVVIVEPVDPRSHPNLTPHAIHVHFRDGRVTSIQRVEEM